MTDAVCSYAQENPETDVIHVWLSDGTNNQCECEACAEQIPSDWYLILLNEIDRELTRRKQNARICFLIYSDLLWPPETQKFVNPDRFLLMFAPISRSYRSAFLAKETPKLPPYRRNKIVMPSSVDENLAFLNQWRTAFAGDGFLFDYHYMWAHHKDAGGCSIARLLYEDIKNLKDITAPKAGGMVRVLLK